LNSPFNEKKYKELLKGLEVSEIRFSEYLKTYRLRLDSEYYLKLFLSNEKYLTSNIQIKDICHIDISNIKSISLNKNFNYLEISDVKANNIDYFCNKIDYKEIPDRATYILRDNDVVVSTVRPNRNSVAFIYNAKRLVGTSGFTVLRADKNKISPYYLYVFCKTKYFITKLMRENSATMYPAVSDHDILNVRIPLLNDIQKNIEKAIKKAIKSIEQSQSLYRQAEDLLLETIGLKNFKPSSKGTNIKSFKKSFLATGRLDAEYYQPKYEDYIQLIKCYPSGFKPLQAVCTLKDGNFVPEETKEYQYIELSDIGKFGNVTDCTLANSVELPSRARRKVNTNDVIISSIEGSLESCALITECYDNALCSTGFYVINSSIINSETLLVLFKSETMQNILKQNCSGTILTAINKNEFLQIPVPLITPEIQQQISTLIQESFALRAESERLLYYAKNMVEREIEKECPTLRENHLKSSIFHAF
jgi:type I restriction enzyme S subunit/type I restriction enzyme M protein